MNYEHNGYKIEPMGINPDGSEDWVLIRCHDDEPISVYGSEVTALSALHDDYGGETTKKTKKKPRFFVIWGQHLGSSWFVQVKKSVRESTALVKDGWLLVGVYNLESDARKAKLRWENENLSPCLKCGRRHLDRELCGGVCKVCQTSRCGICKSFFENVIGGVCDQCLDNAIEERLKVCCYSNGKDHWTREYINWNDPSVPVGKRKVVFVKWLMKKKRYSLDRAKIECGKKFKGVDA